MPPFLFGPKCVLFREFDCFTAQKPGVSKSDLVAHGTYADTFSTTSNKPRWRPSVINNSAFLYKKEHVDYFINHMNDNTTVYFFV